MLSKKKCSETGCNNPVWSNKLCKYHQSSKKRLQNKPKQYVCTKKEYFEFLISIWNTREHKCEDCNILLGKEPLTYMFDHVLEKNKYPQFTLEEKNIVLVCFKCHNEKTNGTISSFYEQKINQVKNELRTI